MFDTGIYTFPVVWFVVSRNHQLCYFLRSEDSSEGSVHESKEEPLFEGERPLIAGPVDAQVDGGDGGGQFPRHDWVEQNGVVCD